MSSPLAILVTAILSILAVHWIYPRILKLAIDRKLYDRPDDRKLQQRPVPVLGGLAVAFGLFAGLLAAMLLSLLMGQPSFMPPIIVIMALVVMLAVGAADDFRGLSARLRFVIEIFVVTGMVFASDACIDSLHGLWGIGQFAWCIGVPLTAFACVGIINAINMIDGVNGLSSSLCIISSMLFGFVFLQGDQPSLAILNFAMAASLLPFLVHNVVGVRSKMFIGDAGTMMMGILMSCNVVQLLRFDASGYWQQQGEEGLCLAAMALSILALPVADTLRVMTQRIARRQSPFSADKTHLHHVLLDCSSSHILTTLTEVLIAIAIFVAWLLTYLLGGSLEWQLYVTVLAAMCLVWGAYAILSDKHSVCVGFSMRLRRMFARLRQGNATWWQKAQLWVDGDC